MGATPARSSARAIMRLVPARSIPNAAKNRATGKPAGIAITKNRGFSGSGFRAAAAAASLDFRLLRAIKRTGRPEGRPVGRSTALVAMSVRHRQLRVGRIGRVLLLAADERDGGVQRLVVLRVRRGIALRAGFLVAFRLQ